MQNYKYFNIIPLTNFYNNFNIYFFNTYYNLHDFLDYI